MSQQFKIMRQRKSDSKREFLSQKMRRWLSPDSHHRPAKVAEQIADEFIESMKGTPEEKIYHYLKVMA